MGSQTEVWPKALIEIAGQPLLGHLLSQIDPQTEGEVLVITGFESEKIIEFLATQPYKVQTIFNPFFMEGSVLTLFAAYDQLQHGDFVLMNADHLFSRQILLSSFAPCTEITAICDSDRILTSDDMKVQSDAQGHLQFMDKKLEHYTKGYIGMTLVPAGCSGLYWDCAKKILEKNGRFVHVEQILNEVVFSGGKVVLRDVSGSVWFEVDTPEDLTKAKSLIGQIL